MPDGYGTSFEGRVRLTVQDRRLKLPSGQTCLPEEPGCAKALADLKGEKLWLELDSTLRLADLSAPLSALAQALKDGDTCCLAVADGKGRRCVPFRPFSGDDFGAWLDADKPLGKVRVIMRADGLEVVTDRGKVPGPDRFGPSLPSLGTRPDFDALDTLLSRVKAHFPDETMAGLAPSPSISVAQAAHVLALLSGPGGARFEQTFLVFP